MYILYTVHVCKTQNGAGGYEKDLIRLVSEGIEVSVHFMFHYFQKVYKCECPFHVGLIPQWNSILHIYKCTLVFSVNFGTICLYGYTGFHQEFTSVISLLRYGTVLVIHIRK